MRVNELVPDKVFTPGKLPIRPGNVYASRGEAQDRFTKAVKRAHIPVVFGEYGVGKTSMARYVLRDDDQNGKLVNVESVAGKRLADIFQRCLEKIGYSVKVKSIDSSQSSINSEISSQVKVGISWISALIASKFSGTEGRTEQIEEQFVVTSPTDSKIIEVCEQNSIVLILDELHKASQDFAIELADFLKAYGNANCEKFRVILLGTSSEASRLVKVDPGIDRLIQEIHLKSMTEAEAGYVVQTGMRELGIDIQETVANRLVRACVGSPNILQFLCLETAEEAFKRIPKSANIDDVNRALQEYVEMREARLYRSYKAAIETVGSLRYRKQILRAMAECEDEYVTMDEIRVSVTANLGKDVPSTTLSGPLRDLKANKFGPILADVDRPDGSGRLVNYTTFVDPAMKAFIRMQVLRETEQR